MTVTESKTSSMSTVYVLFLEKNHVATSYENGVKYIMLYCIA